MIDKIKDNIILPNISLLGAMTQMDRLHVKNLFVFEGERFLSLLTIGDIQRALIKGLPLTNPVSGILNTNKIYALVNEPMDSIIKKMQRLRSECMPILDESGNLKDVIFWKDIVDVETIIERPKINLPVVIMAGGKGTRLKPLTNVIPKPLIPIGEKTILEIIMDQFESIGCNQFFLSVNYKYDILRYYLSNLQHQYNIEFFKEDKPLGTIGSVSLLKNKISKPFFVSNCDILIDQDFRDVYKYHQENKNDITIITSLKSNNIPYGVIETGEDGIMQELTEKPNMAYMINTGVYILQPELIDFIPENEFYHITQLIEKVKLNSGRIGCFPVSENSWTDIGEWNDYLKLINVR